MPGTKTLICLVVAMMFYLLVWPTLYRYDHLGNYPVRINRVTGDAEMLRPEGWAEMKSYLPKSQH